jgi:hypothetical protein
LDSADPRRAVPRTDAVLADPRLVAATATLGRAYVKRAVTGAQERARRGEIRPEDVADVAAAALPVRQGGLRPVHGLGRDKLAGAGEYRHDEDRGERGQCGTHRQPPQEHGQVPPVAVHPSTAAANR